ARRRFRKSAQRFRICLDRSNVTVTALWILRGDKPTLRKRSFLRFRLREPTLSMNCQPHDMSLTCAKSSATPITADCSPRRSFHRTLDRILQNAGFKGNDDGPGTV